MVTLCIRGHFAHVAAQCWNLIAFAPICQQVPEVRLIVNAVQLAELLKINNQ
jgi:hypothetical protein